MPTQHRDLTARGTCATTVTVGQLNDSQRRTVCFALAARDVALIHGPPGTGKTTTVVELIGQLLQRADAASTQPLRQGRPRILACAPSNVAVDNLVERLAEYRDISVVRLGHPARLLPSVLEHALDAAVARHDAGVLANDVRRDMDAAWRAIRAARVGSERRRLYGEVRQLRSELRRREGAALRAVIDTADVVACTCAGAASRSLDAAAPFDYVIIDEAPQALESMVRRDARRTRRTTRLTDAPPHDGSAGSAY